MAVFKTGLDYFSFNVDFFADEKIEFVAARFGLKGELIAVKLLCKIYRNGYYSQWTDDDAIMFAKRVGDGVTPALVNDVVNELAKRGFFDKDILSSFDVLTSRGIQNRYFEAVERRKSIDVNPNYLLIDVSKYENVNIIEPNVNITAANDDNSEQKKVKESKVNESKGESGAGAPPHPPDKSFKNFTEKDFVEELKEFKEKYPREILNSFFKYWKEKNARGKMRFQLEKTWETNLRLEKWAANQQNFKQNGAHKQSNGKPVPQAVTSGGFGQL